MEPSQAKAVIEALVFVAESPVTLEAIREVLGEVPKKDLQRILEEMVADYRNAPRGFSLVEVGGGYQFRTRPEHAEWVKKLKKIRPFALSQPSLETLAIVAYKQPVLRSEIEKIRGVDSGGVLRTLLEKKLVKILGKKDVPGKPLVYGTSRRFLEMFGLKDLSGLPTLKDLAGLGPPSSPGEVLPLGEAVNAEEEIAPAEEEKAKAEGIDEKAGEDSEDFS